jgi:hypothetical protein
MARQFLLRVSVVALSLSDGLLLGVNLKIDLPLPLL